MNKTITIFRKGVVALCSFALVATIFSGLDVGMHNSNDQLSSVTAAQAGSISLVDNANTPKPLPAPGKCQNGGCTVKVAPSGNNAGAVNPRYRAKMYSCSITRADGLCFISSYNQQETQRYTKFCQMTLLVNGRGVATGGPGAVTYLKSVMGGIWNPWGNAEQMMGYLTGKKGTDVWLNLASWSGASGWGYSGAGAGEFGGYKFGCVDTLKVHPPVNLNAAQICRPKNDGRPYPYSVGYYVTQYNHNIDIVLGKKNKDWKVSSASCIYVSPSTPPPMKSTLYTCYWNVKYSGAFSTSRPTIKNGGAATKAPTINSKQVTKKPYISGKTVNSTLKDCSQSLNMDASLPLDKYGYYRLQATANVSKFRYYYWNAAWMGQKNGTTAKIVAAGTTLRTVKVYGTNVCRKNSPNTWKQAASYAALPGNLDFSYSECNRNYTWQCNVTSPKINGVSNSIQVMRDGSLIPVNLGGVTVTGSTVRGKGSSSGVPDANRFYKVSTKSDSSPKNGTNSNSSKQYFELWKNNKQTETRWDVWETKPTANKNSYLSFYWSSDNGKSWSMSYEGKVNSVEFKVPYQSSTKSKPTTKWEYQATASCGTANSNKVTVLRSVSSEG